MTIVFVCLENSSRAHMAAGLAQKILGPSFKILSAGSVASHDVRREAIEIMYELGINIASMESHAISTLNLEEVDLLITLSSGHFERNLPARTEHLHWPVPDPEGGRRPYGERLQRFREVRDLIKLRLRIFLKEHV
jgi:arsenate reductase (thioredoxin)